MDIWHIILPILGLIIGAAATLLVFSKMKKDAIVKIKSADEEATRLYNEAIKAGESKKREMLLEAKEEIHKTRTENEKEIKERRTELSKQERRLQQKEESLDKKLDNFERKEEELRKRQQAVAATQEEVSLIKKSQLEMLEKISGLSQEEAKVLIIKNVEQEARHDAAVKLKDIEAELKDNADQLAREIISTAIQRCAADHAAEA
ncbi:MAG: DUF3552 domain-containing protein, partial [Oscillospiraceae bacterium]|nr:DUF3552 domain-containing protein [Oscillospiraceae bacterium]